MATNLAYFSNVPPKNWTVFTVTTNFENYKVILVAFSLSRDKTNPGTTSYFEGRISKGTEESDQDHTGMLQSARATTDEVVDAIKITNEIHQQNLLFLLLAGNSPAVDLKSGEITKLDSLFEYTPITRLDSSSDEESEAKDEFELISQSSQHEVDPQGLSINNEMDLSETCEEVEENEMDLDLQEPSVVYIIENNSEGLEWDNIMRKAIAKDQLISIDMSKLVWWGLTVVVYAFAAIGDLFHLVLMYEAFLPSSCEDLYTLELCYLVLKEYKKKLDEVKNMLYELNRKKVQLITRKRDLEESTGSFGFGHSETDETWQNFLN
ncbi:hypothetical protein C1645_821376 [Glomus cerebriforme]|uniref:Uncharacterized protein n=1 Tax=Glomus cerebriforme TaxID=658196 RepID=A0A397T3J1_9GLOM|nr:hypothetical protein C1645_821376 [Glomus cerebriforme]